MRLIPQDNDMACWYASAMMLVEWHRRYHAFHQTDLKSPAEVPRAAATHRKQNGLSVAQNRMFAQDLGLVDLPAMSPTFETLEQWVVQYGPIWTTGRAIDDEGRALDSLHVFVIAGTRGMGKGAEFLMYNPGPPHIGEVSWRPFAHLDSVLSSATIPAQDISFLRLP